MTAYIAIPDDPRNAVIFASRRRAEQYARRLVAEGDRQSKVVRLADATGTTLGRAVWGCDASGHCERVLA